MLPSASSAGSALSAAISGVSPFATRRSRQQPVTPSNPAGRDQGSGPSGTGRRSSSNNRGGNGTNNGNNNNNDNNNNNNNNAQSATGSDSCFGVRSLDGSESWAELGGDGGGLHAAADSPGSNSGSGSVSEPTSDDEQHDDEQQHAQGQENDRGSGGDRVQNATTTTTDKSPTADIAEAMGSRIDKSTILGSTPTAHATPQPHAATRHASESTRSAQSSASSTSTMTATAGASHAPSSSHTRTHAHSHSHSHSHSSSDDNPTPHPPHQPPTSEGPTSRKRSLTPVTSPAVPAVPLSPSPARVRRGGGDLAPIMPPPPIPIMQHTLLDMLADAPSEPSSPASLASLPSCVASMSSLSRMSSPADWDWRHPLSRSVATVDSRESASDRSGRGHRRSDTDADNDDDADPHSGSAELVLPTLALPNTSLHLGLERWNTPGQGTRIALVASPERTRDVLGVLAARRPCVQLPRGEVGVLSSTTTTSASAGDIASHPPTIQATIVTCLSADQIRQRASDAFTNLHALLNPSPSREHQTGLEAMVSAYASSKDWIHLAVLLDDAAEDGTDIDIVPCTTLEEEAALVAASSEGDGGVHSEADMPSSTSLSPTSSFSPSSSTSLPDRTPRSTSGESLSDLRVQDTPRPPLDSLEPEPVWPTDETTASSPLVSPAVSQGVHESLLESHNDLSHVDPCDPVFGTVALLERIIDNPARVHAASTAAFFEWRPTPLPDIASPVTRPSTSPASSTFEGVGPMPTVARAQGGGEWEATLSRRLAHRRELDATASSQRGTRPRGRGRGTRRRRSHSPPSKPPCPTPLFPRRPAASSVGLVDLLDAAFAPVRRFVRSPWGQVVVACAIAVAVGCGIWAVRAQA